MQNNLLPALFLLAAAGAVYSVTARTAHLADESTMVERGQYLVRVSGCNDCHTPGYAMSDGDVPVSQWLTGDSLGWRGPWGTTYGANLRLFVKDLTEDDWVEVAHTLRRRPPMPWFNLNRMNDADLRAIYQFIHSLGDPGQPAPAFVPPDEEPHTPYAMFPSPPAPGANRN